jgi:ribonuclease HI
MERLTHKTNNPEPKTTIQNMELTDYLQGTIVIVYTDGSLKRKQMGSAGIIEYTTNDGTTKKITQTCKPTPSNPSSTKGELMAIYMVAKSAPKHVPLHIHCDSQAAINAIKAMTDNPTQREKIKICDYPLVEAIVHEFHQFTITPKLIKVRAHTGIELNEEADKAAKMATWIQEPTDFCQYKNPTEQELDYHLYHKKTRIDRYPRIFIKDKATARIQQEHRSSLVRKHADLIGKQTVDIKLTNRVATVALERDNHLDHINHRKHSFILNVLAKNLQTADKMINYKFMDLDFDHCFYCAQENIYTLYSNDHFWICPQTHAQRRAIKTNAIARLTRWERGNLGKITSDQANIILDKIGIMHNEFFNKPISRGIITKQKMKMAHKQGIGKHLLTYAT